MHLLSVKNVIYFYIFICIALLVFNLLYILRSGRHKRLHLQKRRYWESHLDRLTAEGSPLRDSRPLLRRLRDIQELMAFHEAMAGRFAAQPEQVEAFFVQNRETVLKLAAEYRKRPAMEQAFFAYMIAAFHPAVGERRDPLLEQLLAYMEGSTVYSRENILHAFYALGNLQAVEHAFALMSQQGWYHDPRLLSDGLIRFQGDREALAQRLWDRRDGLLECFQVGTVRFAASLTGDRFALPFLEALEKEALPLETQFALVRYFQRHAVPQAKPLLLQALAGHAGGGQELAIVAATALSAYPGADTRQALKTALHSPNWYIRQNAARSLRALGLTRAEAAQVRAEGDRYATEMLEYVLGYQLPENANESEVPVTV